MSDLRLFSGDANPELAGKIADNLGVELGHIHIRRFADGETSIQIDESARGMDVFIVQPTCRAVDSNLMQLLIMIDAFRRASARRITAVIPYYGYARQDKKIKPREPITARLIANLITVAGAHRVLCVDLHAGQIQGFFDIPLDHLYAGPIIGEDLRSRGLCGDDALVVSPDVGGVTRARSLAEQLGSPLAIIAKRRPEPNQVQILEIVGDVAGRTCVMIDDMIDTGGSIVKGAEALIARGARAVHACCTHGILSGNAVAQVEASPLASLLMTDTVPPLENAGSKIRVVSVAPLLANAIQRIHANDSVSELFGGYTRPT
ncbi:MAG: ribose-phosphate pyrophosphokinase [Armatimonadetes bacterium]|nr:ribose-phosphate pyrophosphokinase [Armatimonadota bacterium]